MHERLLEMLRGLAQVKLVASYRDDALGFPDRRDLRIFLPDLHLCSAARARTYHYETNCERELLIPLVAAIAELKAHAAGDETVAFYQIGDYLDLWREFPSPACGSDVPGRILDDHAELHRALHDPRLHTHFLLGNHDFDLYQWPPYAEAWERRFYIRAGGGALNMLAMHGDYFDWVERLPDRVQEFAVYYFAPSIQPPKSVLGKMNDLSHDSHQGKTYEAAIQLPRPAKLGPSQSTDLPVPENWNVQTAGASSDALQFLNSAFRECENANRKYELDVRVVIIGHTHRARIAKLDAGGKPFVLVDCGAWIEGCQEVADGPVMPNAQIAAVSGNEIRIYQLGCL